MVRTIKKGDAERGVHVWPIVGLSCPFQHLSHVYLRDGVSDSTEQVTLRSLPGIPRESVRKAHVQGRWNRQRRGELALISNGKQCELQISGDP